MFPKQLEVYWDSNFTNIVNNIAWGYLTPGSVNNMTCYIRNLNTTHSMLLNLTTNDWNPVLAEDYIYLSWNCSSYVLPPSSYVCCTLTLTINASIHTVTDFYFNMLVSGEEI